MPSKSTMQPRIPAQTATYRAEGATSNPLVRGTGVIQGTADDQAIIPGAAGRCLGVVMETVSVSNAPVSIALFGEVIALAGVGGVVAGNAVKIEDAEGKFVASAAEDVEIAGFARSTQATDGSEFLMFVNPSPIRS